MHFELLYFEGCPSWHQAVENLWQALREESLSLDISLVQVANDVHARAIKFTGSPSIRFSGRDLFPEHTDEYGLTCRVYQTEEGLKGWPTVRMLRKRLRALGVVPGTVSRVSLP